MLVDIENNNIHVTLNLQDPHEYRIFNSAVEDTGMTTIKKFFREFPWMCEAFSENIRGFSVLIAKFKNWRNQKAFDVQTMQDFLLLYSKANNPTCLIHHAPDRFVFMEEYCSRYKVFGHCELNYYSRVEFKPTRGIPYVEQFADFLIKKRVIGSIDREYFITTFAKINSNHHKHHAHITIGDYL